MSGYDIEFIIKTPNTEYVTGEKVNLSAFQANFA